MFKAIKKLFRKEIIIKYIRIRKPKKGEMLVFNFPEDIEPWLLEQVKHELDYAMRSRGLLIVSGDVKVFVTKKIKITKKKSK